MHYNLAFIGFGNVGRALLRLLTDQSSAMRDEYGIEWSLAGVATRRMGWVADARGLDVDAALRGPGNYPSNLKYSDVAPWLGACEADVLFEMSSLDVLAGEPALSHMCAALERGIHAITANKGPIVFGYETLQRLAAEHGAFLRFESTVMDGAPIFSLFRESLPLARVSSFEGILNSTSNLIIEQIEQGSTMDAAIARAQALGLAETDPTADIDGFDAAVKVAALASVIMNVPVTIDAVERRGIRELEADAIRAARAAGSPYKLMCRARRTEKGIQAVVRPEQVDATTPFAQVNGASSIVRFNTDLVPGISIVEHEPTPQTTAYGMLADFIGIARNDPRRS